MSADILTVGVGDVLAVSTGNSWAKKLIDIGAVLRGQAGLDNHIVVVHHFTDGIPWGIEGKPGGVGWADLRRYLSDPHTVSNDGQPRSDPQRAQIAAAVESMLGVAYDWEAIADDALRALNIPSMFAENWHGKGAPGHVVCSSLAAWAYGTVGLVHPGSGTERRTTPADWTEFILNHRWAHLP